MLKNIIKEEKKVEYLELIYDLIFVYIIGRNNSLLHHMTDGFIQPKMFLRMFCVPLQSYRYGTFHHTT